MIYLFLERFRCEEKKEKRSLRFRVKDTAMIVPPRGIIAM